MNKFFSNRIVQAGLALSAVFAGYFIYSANTETESVMDNVETAASAQENTGGLIIKTVPAVNVTTEDIIVETVASPDKAPADAPAGKDCNPPSPSSDDGDSEEGQVDRTTPGVIEVVKEDGC